MTRTGWYNKNKLGNSIKHESHRHSLAANGIRSALPKGSKCVTICAGMTPNFDMVAKGKMTYDDFSKKNIVSRLFAVGKITDQKLLGEIALKDKSGYLRQEIIDKLKNQNVLEKIALNDSNSMARFRATEKVINQTILKNIAKNDEDDEVRQVAVQKITDKKFLEQVALRDRTDEVRREAIKKVTNQKVLEKVALNPHTSLEITFIAIKRITSVPVLNKINKLYGENPSIRIAVGQRIRLMESWN